MISVATVLATYGIDINNMNTRCLKCSINHYCTYYNQKYLIPIDLFVPNSFPYMDPILYIRPPAGIAFHLLSILGSKVVPVPNVVDAEGRIIYILVSNLKNVPFPLYFSLLSTAVSPPASPSATIPSRSTSLRSFFIGRLINQCSELLYPRFASKFDESKRIFHIFALPAEKAAEAKSLLVPLISSSDRLVVHREANRGLRRRAGDAAKLRDDAADAEQAAERESRR